MAREKDLDLSEMLQTLGHTVSEIQRTLGNLVTFGKKQKTQDSGMKGTTLFSEGPSESKLQQVKDAVTVIEKLGQEVEALRIEYQNTLTSTATVGMTRSSGNASNETNG